MILYGDIETQILNEENRDLVVEIFHRDIFGKVKISPWSFLSPLDIKMGPPKLKEKLEK
jgi:hypothetical protein